MYEIFINKHSADLQLAFPTKMIRGIMVLLVSQDLLFTHGIHKKNSQHFHCFNVEKTTLE